MSDPYFVGPPPMKTTALTEVARALNDSALERSLASGFVADPKAELDVLKDLFQQDARAVGERVSDRLSDLVARLVIDAMVATADCERQIARAGELISAPKSSLPGNLSMWAAIELAISHSATANSKRAIAAAKSSAYSSPRSRPLTPSAPPTNSIPEKFPHLAGRP